MTFKKFLVGSAILGVAGLAPAMAAASSSDGCSVYYGVAYDCGDNTNANAAAETDTAATRGSVMTIGGAISGRASQALAGGGRAQTAMADGTTGVAAGDGTAKYGLWASLSGNALSSSVLGAGFDGTIGTQTVGIDTMLNDNTVAGVSLVHEGTSLTTDFNSGKLNSDGWSVVPYAGYNFGQGTTIDALAGFTYTTAKATRLSGAADGRYSGYRVMAAANIHHTIVNGAWAFRADAGWSGAYARNEGYDEKGTAAAHQDEQSAHLSQGRIGGRVSYLWDKVEPYGQVAYSYDFVADQAGFGSNDQDEVITAIGLDWYPTATESVGVELFRSFLREKNSSMGLLLNARLAF
jgi:uncharacterized protein YhjY with autotransporter beta-barrel domain